MPYPDYLETPHWRRRRERSLWLAGHRCEHCGRSDGGPLEVHHLTYDRRGWEADEDLIVLCGDCHELAHAVGPDEAGAWRAAPRFEEHHHVRFRIEPRRAPAVIVARCACGWEFAAGDELTMHGKVRHHLADPGDVNEPYVERVLSVAAWQVSAAGEVTPTEQSTTPGGVA